MLDKANLALTKIKEIWQLFEQWERGVSHELALSVYDAEPARSSVSDIHGGIQYLATAVALNSSTPINITKGPGKIVIVVNAGSDITGPLTVTGVRTDRETGVETPAYAEVITVSGLTTDSSAADANGNTVYGFSNAYITSSWFSGSVSITTGAGDLTLTDVDVLHVSFEQMNDSLNFTVETLDANILTTNIAAEFDCYLYRIVVSGNTCVIDNISSLHVGTVGTTAIANRYFRLRRGNIGAEFRGKTDGIWMDVHYSNSPTYIEDVNIKVWVGNSKSWSNRL